MGIAFVLIFYFVVLSIAAVICSAIMVAAIRYYLREVPNGRARIIRFAAILPFACVAFAGIWFIGYAVINDEIFHRDPMIGDGWYAPIGNGYAIDMIDVTDQGYVHPIGGDNNGLNDPGGVSGVRRMQVVGFRVFGSEDKNWFQNEGRERQEEDDFFAVDTRDRAKIEFSSEADLAAYAKQYGVMLGLRPIADVYDDYRFTWFDGVAAFLLVAVPGLIFLWLVRRIIRFKRQYAGAKVVES